MELSSLTTGIQHIGVPTTDIVRSAAFYESLGFRTELDTINETNGARVVFLRLHNLVIETYESPDAVGQPGAIDHIALDATDVDAAGKRACGFSRFSDPTAKRWSTASGFEADLIFCRAWDKITETEKRRG